MTRLDDVGCTHVPTLQAKPQLFLVFSMVLRRFPMLLDVFTSPATWLHQGKTFMESAMEKNQPHIILDIQIVQSIFIFKLKNMPYISILKHAAFCSWTGFLSSKICPQEATWIALWSLQWRASSLRVGENV